MSFRAPAIKCTACGKTVYAMEAMKVEDKTFHKSCLKCAECNSVLRLGNYAAVGGKYYCKPHFKQLFKLKGNYNISGESTAGAGTTSFSIPTGPVNFARVGSSSPSPMRSSAPKTAPAAATSTPAPAAETPAPAPVSTPTPTPTPVAETPAPAAATPTPTPAATTPSSPSTFRAATPSSGLRNSSTTTPKPAEPAAASPSVNVNRVSSPSPQPNAALEAEKKKLEDDKKKLEDEKRQFEDEKRRKEAELKNLQAAAAAKQSEEKEAEKAKAAALTSAETLICDAFHALLQDSAKKQLALRKVGL